MREPIDYGLSRRERQIMDVLHLLGRATVREVMEQLPDQPSYSAIRSAIRVLRKKNEVRHEHDGKRYVFYPVRPRKETADTALGHLVKTFFKGSRTKTMAALIELKDAEVSEEELQRLLELIEKARNKDIEQ